MHPLTWMLDMCTPSPSLVPYHPTTNDVTQAAKSSTRRCHHRRTAPIASHREHLVKFFQLQNCTCRTHATAAAASQAPWRSKWAHAQPWTACVTTAQLSHPTFVLFLSLCNGVSACAGNDAPSTPPLLVTRASTKEGPSCHHKLTETTQ